MTARLGIDIGDTLTAWASVAGGPRGSRASGSFASVVGLQADGTLSVGDAVVPSPPGTSVQQVSGIVHHLGRSEPLMLGGTPYGAESLVARLIAAAVAQATAAHGRPLLVTLVHEDGLDEYRVGLFLEAGRLAGIPVADLLLVPRARATEGGAEPTVGAALLGWQHRPDEHDGGGGAALAAGAGAGAAIVGGAAAVAVPGLVGDAAAVAGAPGLAGPAGAPLVAGPAGTPLPTAGPAGAPLPSSGPAGTPIQPPAGPAGTPLQPTAGPAGTPMQPPAGPAGTPMQPPAGPTGTPLQPTAGPAGTPLQPSPPGASSAPGPRLPKPRPKWPVVVGGAVGLGVIAVIGVVVTGGSDDPSDTRSDTTIEVRDSSPDDESEREPKTQPSETQPSDTQPSDTQPDVGATVAPGPAPTADPGVGGATVDVGPLLGTWRGTCEPYLSGDGASSQDWVITSSAPGQVDVAIVGMENSSTDCSDAGMNTITFMMPLTAVRVGDVGGVTAYAFDLRGEITCTADIAEACGMVMGSFDSSAEFGLGVTSGGQLLINDSEVPFGAEGLPTVWDDDLTATRRG